MRSGSGSGSALSQCDAGGLHEQRCESGVTVRNVKFCILYASSPRERKEEAQPENGAGDLGVRVDRTARSRRRWSAPLRQRLKRRREVVIGGARALAFGWLQEKKKVPGSARSGN